LSDHQEHDLKEAARNLIQDTETVEANIKMEQEFYHSEGSYNNDPDIAEFNRNES
jgi:hypothetical protein